MIIKKFPIILAVLMSACIFAQEPLKKSDFSGRTLEPEWSVVTSGTVVSNPSATSKGFCFANDGRMLINLSETGEILWQKPLQGKPNFVSANSDDFVVSVAGLRNVTFYNSYGTILWKKTLPFDIAASPVFGRDGRIFFSGKKEISCFSMSGTEKFNVKLQDLKALPLVFLNDGSILLFYADEKQGKTTGQRISPFGEILGKVMFTSIVKSVAECENGVFVGLENGDCTLICVKDGKLISPWSTTLKTGSNKNAKVHIEVTATENDGFFIFKDGKTIKCYAINLENGNIKNFFPLGDGEFTTVSNISSTEFGCFFYDGIYAREFSSDGMILWEAKMPSKRQLSHVYYSERNNLILCRSTWVLDSFLMYSGTTKKTEKKKSTLNYDDFFEELESISEIPQFLSPLFTIKELEDMKRSLTIGRYGSREKNWISRLRQEFARYKNLSRVSTGNIRPTKTYFDSDFEYLELLIEVSGLFGTDQFAKDLIAILSYDKNPTLRPALLNALGSLGLDRDNEIMFAIKNLLVSKVRPNEKQHIFLICDTLYNICAFTGRKAFSSDAKEILGYLFYPQFDKEVKEYARKTMGKLSALKE